jgi:hypothetical protein
MFALLIVACILVSADALLRTSSLRMNFERTYIMIKPDGVQRGTCILLNYHHK